MKPARPATWVPAALLALLACSDTGGPSEGTVTIRMMHTAVGASALDLMVGGQLIAGGVQFERASAPTTAPGGPQTLAVRRSGESAVLASKNITLTPGAEYTVMVSGSLGDLVLTPSVVVDTGNARPDRANLRIINISTIVIPTDSSNLPPPIPLDVYITAPGAALAGLPSQLSLDARVSSYSSLLYFDPGTLMVRFVTPGSTNVVAATAAIPIAAGEVRAVTLQRQSDGTWRTSVVVE
ncbi:MAG TPA: DUF4397 domain-containing protein [Gemmatimonadales bacterium]|nr:DUF4397 domain-containing protein [Gemmatimonadales bacterium]